MSAPRRRYRPGCSYPDCRCLFRSEGAVRVEQITDRSVDAQVAIALDNFLAVAAAAGATIEDLAKVTIYVVGVENWARFNRLYAERMGAHRPARAVVPVRELHYGYLIEIEGIAVGPR
jgi:enamine deaminase RidA (YjgF/YER057c/UK114 family)